MDDVEVRHRRRAVRRRQGRHHLRPVHNEPRRDRAAHAALHREPDGRVRPGQGHPGARHEHERAGHGVAARHVLDARPPHGARRGDGQADPHRRQPGAPRGDRPRRDDLHALRDGEAGPPPGPVHRRRPGLRQRGLHRGAAAPRAGLHHRRRQRRERRLLQRRRHRHRRGHRVRRGPRPLAGGLRRRRADLERGASGARRGRAGAVRSREPDHRQERRRRAGQDRRRRRERADDGERRRHPQRQRRARRPGHPRERGRRDRQLLRVGAGPPGLLLEPRPRQPPPRPDDALGLRRRLRRDR